MSCDCVIQHEDNEACPNRIAKSFLTRIDNHTELNEADYTWIKNHPDFSILQIVEQYISREIVDEKIRELEQSFIQCQDCGQYEGDGIKFKCRVGMRKCINRNSRASKLRPAKEGRPRIVEGNKFSNSSGWKIPDSVVEASKAMNK